MDKGVTYTFTAAAYPRYRYFQQRLHGLIPRLQGILEAGGLPDCISRGRQKLKEISSSVQQVADKVTVSVFADDGVLDSAKDLSVQCKSVGNVQRESVSKSRYMKAVQDMSSVTPTATVIVAHSQEVIKALSGLPEAQLMNVIIYNDKTNTNCLFTDFVKAGFTQEANDIKERSKCLGKQIQYLLEEKVIVVLEMIVEYIRVFIPKQEEEVDNSLLDEIHIKLIDSLQDEYVVKDLAPDNEVTIASDKELLQISMTLGPNIWSLCPSLGIMSHELEQIKRDHPQSTHQQIYQILLRWRLMKGRQASVEQLLQDIGSEMDTSAIKIENKTDVERNDIFHQKLANFVAKKTKCVACATISKKYGISSSLVNEFLNPGFFNYEAKIIELFNTIILPKWPRDRSDDGVTACRVFSYRCATSITKTIQSTEDYIMVKLEILTVMKKLRFEICGLFLQTDVPVYAMIPAAPKLPLELQYEILNIPDVHGCGTSFGELVLHVTKTLSPASKDEIKELLSKYHYTQGFKSELMEARKRTEQARGLPLEQGQELRAKKCGSSGYSFGTLGCFVHINPKHVPSQSQSKPGSKVSSAFVITESKVHGLTCAHCVRNCLDEVEVRQGSKYNVIGRRKIELYEPEAFDVASIQILDDVLADCDSKLRDMKGVIAHNWRFYEGDPLILRIVQKQGCSTGFTTGIIMCTNYITQEIKRLNRQMHLERQDGRFNESYNILIEPLPGNEQLGHVITGEHVESTEGPFSLDGDSGSVICADIIDDTDSVYVIGLLIGAVGRVNEGDSGLLYSYATHMRKTLDELEVQFDCVITPAHLPGGKSVGGGADLMMAQSGDGEGAVGNG